MSGCTLSTFKMLAWVKEVEINNLNIQVKQDIFAEPQQRQHKSAGGIFHSSRLTRWSMGPWAAAVLKEQDTHTHTQAPLFIQARPSPVLPVPPGSALPQSQRIETGGEGPCWGTDCRPPLSPWEAHCGYRSGQSLGKGPLPVCAIPEVVICPSSPNSPSRAVRPAGHEAQHKHHCSAAAK